MAFRVYNFTIQRLEKKVSYSTRTQRCGGDSSYVQKDATTPNIVVPRMLRVVASVLALVCKRMQQLPPCCNNMKQGVLKDATVT